MISKSDRREITCEICLEVVGSSPAGAVARLVSRSVPVASDPPPSAPGVCRADDGGFCTIRSILPACRRRVAPLLLQFPPFAGALDMGQAQPCTSHSASPPVWCGDVEVQGGEVAVQGGEVAVRGSVAPKVQTTSATNVDNAVSWVRWSAMWARRRLASRGARARTAEYAQ